MVGNLHKWDHLREGKDHLEVADRVVKDLYGNHQVVASVFDHIESKGEERDSDLRRIFDREEKCFDVVEVEETKSACDRTLDRHEEALLEEGLDFPEAENKVDGRSSARDLYNPDHVNEEER